MRGAFPLALRCFVAMALGRPDMDKVYDKLVKTVLRGKKVVPIRIDRLEHNDDIDDRIIQEIEQADFLIADLTYARPSVYFEAGYAQRSVPVIYTCRKDHFKPRADDEYGNFQVHFDLQMKNIIPWRSHTDQQFKSRLASRISKVVAPLLRAAARKAEASERKKEYQSASLHTKITSLLSIAVRHLTPAGYSGAFLPGERFWKRFNIPFTRPNIRNVAGISRVQPLWVGTKRQGRKLSVALVFIAASHTKRSLTAFRDAILNSPVYSVHPRARRQPLTSLTEEVFLVSVRPIPLSRLVDAFPAYSAEGTGGPYVSNTQLPVPANPIPDHPRAFIESDLSGYAHRLVAKKPESKRVGFDQASFTIKGDRLYDGSVDAGRVATASRVIRLQPLGAPESFQAFEEWFSGSLRGM